MIERKYLCHEMSAVRDSGIQAGSRLLIEPDPDAAGQSDGDRLVILLHKMHLADSHTSNRWGGPGSVRPNDGHGRVNTAPPDIR
jgi:hypothetical protein